MARLVVGYKRGSVPPPDDVEKITTIEGVQVVSKGERTITLEGEEIVVLQALDTMPDWGVEPVVPHHWV